MFNVRSLNSRVFVVLLLVAMPLSAAYAANIDFHTIMDTLKKNISPIMTLVVAIAYVIGFWFIISAILTLKKIGQSQGMMSAQMGLGGPILKLVIGIALMYLPSTFDVTVMSIWGQGGTDSLIQYKASPTDPFGGVKEGVIALVRLIGLVSFIKGLITLSHAANQGAQPGAASKGIFHILGGVLALNIVATVRVIGNTLGIPIL